MKYTSQISNATKYELNKHTTIFLAYYNSEYLEVDCCKLLKDSDYVDFNDDLVEK